MAMLSMNEITTYRWSFEQDVAGYVAAGIPAIGVWRQKLSDFGDDKGVELIIESGLKVSNLLWAGGFTGSDGRSFRDSVEDGIEAVRLASALEAGCLVVYSGARGGHTTPHARRLLRQGLKELLSEAAHLNVTLALEPMHSGCAKEWTFLTCLDDVLKVIEEHDHPYLKIAFDTYHLACTNQVESRVAEVAPHVGVVHLGDRKVAPASEQSRCPLGAGILPLREIVTAFAEAGYDGYYDVELIGEEIEEADYRDLLHQSRDAFHAWFGCQAT